MDISGCSIVHVLTLVGIHMYSRPWSSAFIQTQSGIQDGTAHLCTKQLKNGELILHAASGATVRNRYLSHLTNLDYVCFTILVHLYPFK